jgi:acetyl esterase/lipase
MKQPARITEMHPQLRNLARSLFLASVLGGAVGAEETSVVPLWPDGPPGRQSARTELIVQERGIAGGLRDRAATGIAQPTLTVFRANRPNGSGLLIIPGGGYERVVMDKEGYETARWFAERGTTAFVLLYRLPGESWENRSDVVLQDTQRAMRVIRSRAARYSLDRGRIGVMGFSAGGHAAAVLSTRFADVVYPPADPIDETPARPDFTVLMYPVILMDGNAAHAGSRMNLLGPEPKATDVAVQSPHSNVSATTPPTFLLHAADDESVVVLNTLRMHSALLNSGVATELHVFAVGGHGFGMRNATDLPVAVWPELVNRWMLSLFEGDKTR